jgi:phosphatidylserine/phosphatidylglycerophosphate/cardiolipin synthase-like enzyme
MVKKRMFVFLSLLISFSLRAEITSPGLELVITQPVETKLSPLDIRASLDVWLELIDSAKKRLDFSELYINGKDGEPLDKILEHLDQAARRGVKIRIIVDQSMLRASNPTTMDRLKKMKDLQLRQMDFGKVSTGGILHAKYFVVDRRMAFLGSQNFDWRSLKHVHETGVKIFDNAIAKQLQDIFDYDWAAWSLIAEKKKVQSQPAIRDAQAPAQLAMQLP